MGDPTPEAYQAAARALSRVATTHGYRLREEREPLSWAAVDAVWPIAQKAKAAEILGVVRDQLDHPPAPDTRESILARLEREIRAKVAAEIRAADTSDWPGGRWGDVEKCRERAAKIAEGSTDG